MVLIYAHPALYHMNHVKACERRRRNVTSETKSNYHRVIYLVNVLNVLPRRVEWLRDATNALEQVDSFLNKGLNNSFLNYSRCFFLN